MNRLFDIPKKVKQAFVRVDLNVPMKNEQVLDKTRIDKIIPTLKLLLEKSERVVVATHLGRPKPSDTAPSTKILIPYLAERLDQDVHFLPFSPGYTLDSPGIYLLENVRFLEGEEQNDKDLAKQLLGKAEIFVNDAFSCSHRAHASVCAISLLVPTYAGLQMEQELHYLNKVTNNPDRPLTAIVGGSKISTKMDVLQNLLAFVDYLVVGGAMANTFLKAQGYTIGTSLCEDQYIPFCHNLLKQHSHKIILPADYKVANSVNDYDYKIYHNDDVFSEMILDIGPMTYQIIESVLKKSKTVCWNGPVGAYEYGPYGDGSKSLAQLIATRTTEKKLTSILGGGDTIAVINEANVFNDISYISTAGGAFLEFLEGKKLPGLQSL